MKLKRSDIVFLLLMLLIITTLGFLLKGNYERRSGASEGALKVGEVHYKYHVVQRRFVDRLIWEDVDPLTQVYLYDSILTQNKSDAVITLDNGFQLDLDPNSMVEIDIVEDKVGIALKRGVVRAKGSGEETMLRMQDGSVLKMKNSEARISTTREGSEIDVIKGKVTLVSPESEQGRQKQKLKQGDFVEVRSDGTLNKSKNVFEEISPEAGRTFRTRDKAGVQLAWKTSEDFEFDETHVIVSESPDFSQPLRINAEKNPLTLEMSPGTYYWRIEGTDKEGKKYTSPSRTLRIYEQEEMRVFSPQDGEEVYEGEGTTFSWQESENNSLFDFTLAEDPEMKEEIMRRRVAQNRVHLDGLEPGRYYWKIVPATKDENAIVEDDGAKPNVLVVREKSKSDSDIGEDENTESDSNDENIAKSEDLSGDGKESEKGRVSDESESSEQAKTKPVTFTKSSLNSPGSSVFLKSDAPLVFSWKNRSGYTYRVNVYQDGKRLRSRVVRGGKLSLSDLPPGSYRYSVTEINPDGRETGTASRNFTLDYPIPPPPEVKSVKVD